jgi:cation diffusion facilitator CzcD-associated flavoprotein CzcO
MLDVADTNLATQVDDWLADFERALADGDAGELAALLCADSYWRDVLAFTWTLSTVHGAQDIAAALIARSGKVQPADIKASTSRTPPRIVMRAGTEALEAFFDFSTVHGRGEGVLRLIPASDDDGQRMQAWTLMTALQELRGFEEHLDKARPKGEAYSRDFHGPNWLDLRQHAMAYRDHDPDVVVVGCGQAGLAIAARLTQLGVDALIVDRHARIGDNWRKRYHALTLHNQVQVNHMPYMPFPPNWPTYIPKDKLANWFEAYVEAMELNVWTGTEFLGGDHDAESGCWTVRLRLADGSERTMRPRHVVMATGVSGIPSIPQIPTLDAFNGTLLHSSRYDDAEPWAGKRAIVIGTGNSGHDIAQDLHAAGAKVTLVQRSPTMVVNIEPSAQIPYALYDEGPPLDDCDLITASMPFALARRSHIAITRQAQEIDRDLLERLAQRGFKLDFGPDGSGWQFLYLTRGGGYYFNVGCSDLIADGEVDLIQYEDIERFVASGAVLKDGTSVPADLIVLATGYKSPEAMVQRLFGDAIAQCVGGLWGFDAGDELRNTFVRTGQPGLWFIAGSLAQCRIFSKYLALQIKACEEGLIAAAR